MKSKGDYNHGTIEKKWQEEWSKTKVYSPSLDHSQKPFYNLMMFPYPSAEGLHAGNMFAFTGSDVFGRFKRMLGYNVFQPIGLDGFGIHSENYAMKVGRTPQENARITESNYYKQLHEIGDGFDWDHVLETYDVDYYHWTEWVFIQLFKAGLAYRKKAVVNFCPKDKTVLSDEQVMTPKQAGKEPLDAKGNPVPNEEGLMVCERCGTIVEKKELEVWFFRITDYADRLLNNLEKLEWSERVKVAQKEWIGKSEGMVISFKKENGKDIKVYTTRPDTLNSATFIVVADQKLYDKHKNDKDKFGEFTGEYVIHPFTKAKLPIWKANYVAPGYGTGAVMGVPAYDERDKAFAKKYKLKVLNNEPDEKLWGKIEKEEAGKKYTNYHLRDWGIGRQRYWGCPIPMIHCERCAHKGEGWFSKSNKLLYKQSLCILHKDQSDWDWQGWWPEEKLPVELPVIKDYQPEGSGRGPLANHPEFYMVKCPHCGADAKRETDVADTFLDSSWYFFRYPSTDDKSCPWKPERTKKWLPVGLYFGGAEHAVLHLMYARFMTMVFRDLKLITHFEEPFPKFFAHGLVIKDGAKMSKSRGNVVNPDEYIEKYGADTLRTYLMFMGPMDSTMDFRDSGIEGMQRFIRRVWSFYQEPVSVLPANQDQLMRMMHKTIKKVTEDIEVFHYNTAISAIMELVNYIKENGSTKESLEVLCKLIAPFAPHLAEELWVKVLGNKYSVHVSKWPEYSSKYIKSDQYTIIVQINGKTRSQLVVGMDSGEDEIKALALGDPKVQKWLSGKYRTIFVPGKIINFVTR